MGFSFGSGKAQTREKNECRNETSTCTLKGLVSVKGYLSISEMAELHGVSRQTLIYYDRIGLFKPEYTAENGFRYYSPYQIPFLREICFLKAIGVKLEDIRKHIRNRNLNTAISLLECHKAFVDEEIGRLVRARQYIGQRLRRYSDAQHSKNELNKPMIKRFPERKIVFFPFQNRISKQELHLTLMRGWNVLIAHGMLPAEGWGTMIMKDSLDKDYLFEGAGIYIPLPFADSTIENVVTVPEGEYACMYKYGMPYDEEHLYKLLKWVEHSDYKVVGNILDKCLLDTTFYGEKNNVDYCQIQIPVEKHSR